MQKAPMFTGLERYEELVSYATNRSQNWLFSERTVRKTVSFPNTRGAPGVWLLLWRALDASFVCGPRRGFSSHLGWQNAIALNAENANVYGP